MQGREAGCREAGKQGSRKQGNTAGMKPAYSRHTAGIQLNPAYSRHTAGIQPAYSDNKARRAIIVLLLALRE